MDKKKLLILIILSIFIVGMVCGAASASHTFKKGKYKVTVSDKTYKQIKKGQKVIVKKVGTKKVKVQKYKTKKVTKYKWEYKTVKYSEYWVWDTGSEWKDYDTYMTYEDKGWTFYGTSIKETTDEDGNYHSIVYAKLKKKVKYTTTTKVKNGYKTVKKPLYMQIYSGWTGDLETGHPNGKIHVDLSTTKALCF